MLASPKIIKAFNAQIGHELGASHQYISIAAYFDKESLDQLASFFFRQSEEEREHAMKFVRFILDVDGDVEIPTVDGPPATFKSAHDAVAAALEWEERVTHQIYDLVELCQAERNHIALRFLDWFVEEQLEEVTTMSNLLAVIDRAGDNLLFVEDYLARHGVEGAAAPEG